MRLKHTADMPGWARLFMVAFSLVFGALSYWLVGLIPRGGLSVAFMAIAVGVLAIRVLVGAILGRWTFRRNLSTGIAAAFLDHTE